jgi:hypothetical protein
LVLTQELSKSKHQGIPGRSRDTGFHREYQISLEKTFASERAESYPIKSPLNEEFKREEEWDEE